MHAFLDPVYSAHLNFAHVAQFAKHVPMCNMEVLTWMLYNVPKYTEVCTTCYQNVIIITSVPIDRLLRVVNVYITESIIFL